MTKERPILMSTPMVRATLAGTKTQTRRVLKRQFADDALPVEMPATDPVGGWVVNGHSGLWWCEAACNPDEAHRCPYGKPGDRLWVREMWGLFKKTPDDHVHACVRGDRRADGFEPHYRATDTWDMPAGAWRPSIHMPRWACRLELDVTGVRVERLQAISEADALAEGIEYSERFNGYCIGMAEHFNSHDPRQSYFSLWEAINGPGSVEANPWVWCVEFARVA